MTCLCLYSLFSWLQFGIPYPTPGNGPDSLTAQSARQSISLQLGTTGPGVSYNHELSRNKRLIVRAGGQYFSYQNQIQVKTDKDSYLQIKPDLTIALIQANLKWHPFQQSAFFITGGLGYTWHPDLDLTLTTPNKLNLGGLELLAEDVGTVNLSFRWHPVVGYLGWGFGRSLPKSRLGVGFEMGVFYLGKPHIQLDYEGFLETTTINDQIPVVEHNLSGYRYLPSLNLTLSYKLRAER